MNHVCKGPSKTELTTGFDDDDDELHRCVWKWSNTVYLESEITVCTVAGREASAPLALQPFGSSGLDRNSIVWSLKPTCPCVVLHTVLAVGDWDNHIITFFHVIHCSLGERMDVEGHTISSHFMWFRTNDLAMQISFLMLFISSASSFSGLQMALR